MNRPLRWLLWCIVLTVSCVLPTASWASGPQAERWQTYTTPHFRVHFHASVAPMAEDVATLCEAAHTVLSPLFDYTPRRRTDVVLIDSNESANGSAGLFPRARVTLYATPPDSVDTRTDTDHWMWELILHEYAHVLHIDQVRGLAKLVNLPFGRVFLPNQNLPRWYIEGAATAIESKETGGGRVRSHMYDMYLRAAVLAGTVPTLAQLSNQPPNFPYANAWYLFGSDFVDFIARTRGWDAVFSSFRKQSNMLRPYALNYMALRDYGATLDELYDEWLADAQSRAIRIDHAIVSAGLLEPVPMTEEGHYTQWIATTPQGTLPHWIQSNGKDDPTIRSLQHDGGRKKRIRNNSTFSLFPGGDMAVVSYATPVRSGYSRADLWTVNLKTGEIERLTRGLRAKQPAVSPDGESIAYTSTTDGRIDLYVLDLKRKTSVRVATARPWTTISQPSWSPDGAHIYYSQSEIRNGRDLYVVEVATGRVTRLTNDRAIDDSPAISPSNRWMYYASDRDGVFNIYARDLRDTQACTATSCERVSTSKDRRVTRVRTGVFTPKVVVRPGRCELWMSTYSARGFDIARLELDRDCGPPRRIGNAEASYERPTPEPPEVEPLDAPHRYRTGRLAHPWTWFPVYHQIGPHRQFGLTTSGSDPAGKLQWNANVTLGDPYNQLRWAVDIAYSGIQPDLRFRSVRSVNRRGMFVDSRVVPFDEVVNIASLGTSYRYGGYRAQQHATVGYQFETRGFWQPVSFQHDPGGLMPSEPEMGRFSSLVLGWSISNLRGYTRGVSVERGWSANVQFRLRTRILGSDFESRELTLGAMKAVPIGRWDKHAVVLRLRGGGSQSDFRRRSVYYVGGMTDQNLWEAIRDQLGASTTVVRGFAPGIRHGAFFAMLNAEYRFPLWWIDSGVSTLPLFFDRLTGAVFLDAAVAFDHPTLTPGPLIGMGAELRFQLTAGYYQPQSFRLGVARGFGRDGEWQGYLLFGGSF